MAAETGRPRRNRDQLKELVLDAAVELLYREGLELRPSSITYSRVFAHLEAEQGIRITRGSVHERIWANQADFQNDVLKRAVRWDSTETEVMLRAASVEIERGFSEAGEGEAQSIIREAVRLLGPAFMRTSEEIDHWSSWISTTLASATQSGSIELRDAAQEAACETYEQQTALFEDVAGRLITGAGLRPNTALLGSSTDLLRLAADISIALADGIELRRRLTGPLPEIRAPTGDNGDFQTWDLYGFVMWTLMTAWTTTSQTSQEDEPEARGS